MEIYDLGYYVGNREDRWELKRLLEDLAKKVVDNSALPLELRRKVKDGLKQLETNKKTIGYSKAGDEVEVEEDVQRASTSILDGGAFYVVKYRIPGTELRFRVKQSKNRRKFERGRKIQEFLSLAMDKGLLNGGARVNPLLYRDDRSMIGWELFIDHERLTDRLRKAQTDEDKAALLEQTLQDTSEISRVLTAHREMRDEEGNPLLKENAGFLNYIRNLFPGNLIIREEEPIDRFLSGFLLRNVQYVASKLLDKKGRIKRKKLKSFPEVEELRKAFEKEFDALYKRRKVRIINEDNHTGQVLMTPTGERIYSDFEHCYWGIEESQLAEMVLTSGIRSREVVKGLMDRFYDSRIGEIEVSRGEFWQTFRRKMAEKSLIKAAKLKTLSKSYVGEDRERAEREADAYFSAGINILEQEGLTETRVAVEKINDKYFKLKRTEKEPSLDSTLSSIVHNDTSREASYQPYRKPLESRSVRDFAKKTIIGTVCAATLLALVFGISRIKVEDTSAPQVDYLNLLYQSQPLIDSSTIGKNMPFGENEKNVLRGTNDLEVLGRLLEIKDKNELERIIRENKPRIIPYMEREMNWLRIEGNSREKGVDPDLIKAIYLESIKKEDPVVREKMCLDEYGRPSRKEGQKDICFMFLDWRGPYIQMRIGREQPSTPLEDTCIIASAEFVRDSSRYYQGNFSKIASSYMAGIIGLQEAMIKSGRQDYEGYRGHLSEVDEKLIERIAVNYLALKGVINVPREPKPKTLIQKWMERRRSNKK